MAYNFSHVNVLVVESTSEMFKLLKTVLNMLGVPNKNIYAAYDYQEAIAKFKTGNYDMVITDWLDNPDQGIKLTQGIRKDVKKGNNFVPIIMTAGSSHLSRVMKARDAGVNEYLIKPFAAKHLAQRLERVVDSPRPFVLTDDFVGPDRRVRKASYNGPERRVESNEVEIL